MPSIFRTLFQPRMLITLLMGFSAGLPLLAIGSTLQAWMQDSHVDIKTIGFFAWAGLPYTYKFIWSPVMDGLPLPFLGRRRGWLLVTQLALFILLVFLGQNDPSQNLFRMAILSLAVAFFGASQDIVIDAYRRESLKEEELGLGSSIYVLGYRIAMMVSGALALWMADRMPWQSVYLIIGLCMGVGILSTLFAPEPDAPEGMPKTLKEAVVGPLLDFFSKPHSWGILAFILFYKIGDVMATAITTPFYLQQGYTKTDIGAIVKFFGFIAMISGGLLGGLFITKQGIRKSLWIFGWLQALPILGFSTLLWSHGSLSWLAVVIFLETFTGGAGTSAYVAYMASITNRKFTATQYALLSSLMGVPRVLFAGFSGVLVAQMDWFWYFIFCFALAIPGMILLKIYGPNKEQDSIQLT